MACIKCFRSLGSCQLACRCGLTFCSDVCFITLWHGGHLHECPHAEDIKRDVIKKEATSPKRRGAALLVESALTKVCSSKSPAKESRPDRRKKSTESAKVLPCETDASSISVSTPRECNYVAGKMEENIADIEGKKVSRCSNKVSGRVLGGRTDTSSETDIKTNESRRHRLEVHSTKKCEESLQRPYRTLHFLKKFDNKSDLVKKSASTDALGDSMVGSEGGVEDSQELSAHKLVVPASKKSEQSLQRMPRTLLFKRFDSRSECAKKTTSAEAPRKRCGIPNDAESGGEVSRYHSREQQSVQNLKVPIRKKSVESLQRTPRLLLFKRSDSKSELVPKPVCTDVSKNWCGIRDDIETGIEDSEDWSERWSEQSTLNEPEYEPAVVQNDIASQLELETNVYTDNDTLLQMEIDRIRKELMASKKRAEGLTGNIAEMQEELRSAEEARATSSEVVSEARREIEKLRLKLEVVDKMEADKRTTVAIHKGVKTLLQNQLTDAHVKLYLTSEEGKSYQRELAKAVVATDEQRLERDEQMKYWQERCEKLETSASIANLEHQNAQVSLKSRLVTAGVREQEVSEQIKLMQLQLQEQIWAGDQKMLEATIQKQFLEHENDKLKKEQAARMQMHLDVTVSLETDIGKSEDSRMKAQQQIAVLETQLQDKAIAIRTRELKVWEKIETLQGKLGACEQRLTSLRLSASAAQEELSCQLATVQDCQRKDDVLNQDLRKQLASTQQLVSRLRPQLDAAQVKSAQTLLGRLFAFCTYGACCVCPSITATRVHSRGGSPCIR